MRKVYGCERNNVWLFLGVFHKPFGLVWVIKVKIWRAFRNKVSHNKNYLKNSCSKKIGYMSFNSSKFLEKKNLKCFANRDVVSNNLLQSIFGTWTF